jgi:DNA-binding GntR family transcriptional regulator
MAPTTSGPGRRAANPISEVRAELLARLLHLDPHSDSLVVVIAEWLGRQIIEAKITSEELNTVDLAERFDTSRTPVREALMLLEKEGLVVTSPRRRPRLATLDLRTVEEIYEMRAELLARVASRVAELADPEQLARLREHLAEMEDAAAANDLDAYFWANVAFHERAADIAADRTLKRTIDTLGVRVLQLRHFSMSLIGRMALSLQDHQRLMRAFAERDAQLAAALNRSIIRSALEAIRRSGWTQDSPARHGAPGLVVGPRARDPAPTVTGERGSP